MTQEDKELLLKDLCARLLYGVIVNAQYKDEEGWKTEDRKILGLYEDGQVYLDCVYTTIDCIKPYLRPMSSMTMEEKKELFQLMGGGTDIKRIDFYISHHLDYRGLIEKGLAIEVTEENNPYNS
jgi:hypothetical protein